MEQCNKNNPDTFILQCFLDQISNAKKNLFGEIKLQKISDNDFGIKIEKNVKDFVNLLKSYKIHYLNVNKALSYRRDKEYNLILSDNLNFVEEGLLNTIAITKQGKDTSIFNTTESTLHVDDLGEIEIITNGVSKFTPQDQPQVVSDIDSSEDELFYSEHDGESSLFDSDDKSFHSSWSRNDYIDSDFRLSGKARLNIIKAVGNTCYDINKKITNISLKSNNSSNIRNKLRNLLSNHQEISKFIQLSSNGRSIYLDTNRLYQEFGNIDDQEEFVKNLESDLEQFAKDINHSIEKKSFINSDKEIKIKKKDLETHQKALQELEDQMYKLEIRRVQFSMMMEQMQNMLNK
ncbi:MAG: hypothetical protein AB8B67_04030 [Rickettsiaceae bacterium]